MTATRHASAVGLPQIATAAGSAATGQPDGATAWSVPSGAVVYAASGVWVALGSSIPGPSLGLVAATSIITPLN